jgi:protein required for attachment to host cells
MPPLERTLLIRRHRARSRPTKLPHTPKQTALAFATEPATEPEELIIAAPPHTLAAIREHLDTAAGARIIGTLQKDLVKTPDDELWPHVREWLRPVHRPAG